ncbi:hypothetical protein HUU51_00865 [Candidatus Gracilibacteria bacterium]|nr:hypothetical protein [Candidatus Gracilibacteria bacterium]
MNKEKFDQILVLDGLHYNQGLDLLYNDYKYGINKLSNCFLVNEEGQIFAISWNFSIYNSFIKLKNLKYPGYIVINNKKKLDHKLYIEDIEGLTPFFNGLRL